MQSGVSEEKLARVLNLDIGTIRNKKNPLGNEAVAKCLRELHGPTYDKFKHIAELDFFRLKNME